MLQNSNRSKHKDETWIHINQKIKLRLNRKTADWINECSNVSQVHRYI